MPDVAAGPRREPPTTWALRRHRLATPALRVLLRFPHRRRAPARAAPKITILLAHAWGMGGTIHTMLNVAGGLAERHEVEVISLWRSREEPFFPFPPGVTVTAADDRRPGRGGPVARALARVPGSVLFPGDRTHRRMTLWSDVQLVRRLRGSRPDLVIGTRPALNLLAAQLGGAAACVATEHTAFRVYTSLLRREILRRYGGLDAVVVLDEAERSHVERELRGAALVTVIPNAVPVQHGPRSRLDQPVVVSAGRLVLAKGYDRLIRAFARLAEAHPQWRLRICGHGGQAAALRALVSELGLEGRVELPGPVRDIERELEGASIFALSSRVEGLPLALLEAMGKGLAVVSFDSAAGARDVIEHGVDGLLVPAGDEPALAAAISSLIESAALRRRLGDAAVRKAAAYGLDAVGARWEALVRRLTQE